MIVYRRCRAGDPFLWETTHQPAGRWHGEGEGPVHYFADSPDGAWAEFLRHEHITDPEDLAGIRESLWAIDLPDEVTLSAPTLPDRVLTGDASTYPACRSEARRLRARGVEALRAPSAALLPRGATGWRVEGGLRAAGPRDGHSIVLYGARPTLVGWRACAEGRPAPHLLERVRYLR